MHACTHGELRATDVWKAANCGKMKSFQGGVLLLYLSGCTALHPVILVPGLGGSQIDAKLDKTHSGHFFCSRRSDWFSLWLSLVELEIEYCFVENMGLSFNKTDGTTSNYPGVEIRAPGFGGTDSIEILDPFHPIRFRKVSYFWYLVNRLKKMNYVKNVSIRGAPYDFRKAPNEMKDYFDHLNQLIEETYVINNNKRVVLLAHSMGGNVVLYFLRQKTAAWKDKYIECFLSMGSPWAGSVKILKALVSGDTLGSPEFVVNAVVARDLYRSLPSSLWLVPRPDHWGEGEVLVASRSRNYTVVDYAHLFADVGFEFGPEMRRHVENILQVDEGPGVRTYCMYGLLEPHETPERFVYESAGDRWFDKKPTTIFGPGDGSVNQRSLDVCRGWPNTTVLQFAGVEHLEFLKADQTLDFVENLMRQL